MLSLHARLLAAATLVLAGFLGLTGLALDRAFRQGALVAEQDRLQTQIYMLLGAADLDRHGALVLPKALPEPRLSSPGSGLYAAVTDAASTVVWRSASMLGQSFRLPPAPKLGVPYFQEITDARGQALFTLAFRVSWETRPDTVQDYIFEVAESEAGYERQVFGFRRSLWGWLAAATLILLAVQGVILRWGLAPLRRVADELLEVENGRRGELSGPYPRELAGLTQNLNALIHHSRSHLQRYRNALADLAHSLKTPLAVVRADLDSGSDRRLREAISEQLGSMERTIEYQLQRAAASGRTAMTTPVPLARLTRRVLDALAKVYAERRLQLEADVADSLMFHGDESDLMEILGNLADNACKWAKRRVQVRASVPQPGVLLLEVQDDGPGIPGAAAKDLLERGVRADAQTPGHGIGLAVVRELVEEAYHGRLRLDTAPTGGLVASVEIPGG